MILFKSGGSTYHRVVKKELHAFPYSPSQVSPGEFVLLSKNREDCAPTEQQIQYVAKLLAFRAATPSELDGFFPNESAGVRWGVLACLYWSRKLDRPFNLSQVKGLNHQRYDTVQEFARLDNGDDQLVLAFLSRTNERVILDFLNNAEPPANSECSKKLAVGG